MCGKATKITFLLQDESSLIEYTKQARAKGYGEHALYETMSYFMEARDCEKEMRRKITEAIEENGAL